MNVVVWGAGTWGKRCISFLPQYGVNVVAFIDSDIKKQSSQYLGVPVVSLSAYQTRYSGVIVIIAISELSVSREIKNLLERKNIVCFSLLDCPPELYLTHVGEMVPFDEYIEVFINKYPDVHDNKILAIKGWNFFSLLLYNYFKRKGVKICWIVPCEAKKQYHTFLKHYDVISEEYIDNVCNIEYIFYTDPSEYRYDKGGKHIPFFKFDIARYRNNGLRKFYKMHEGQRCFVVANGPSLQMDDLQCLHEYGELCFGVNGIYHAFSRTDWRPDFYLAGDPKMFEYFQDNILSIDVRYKFLGDYVAAFWKKKIPNNVYRFHSYPVFDARNMSFSDDISVCAYDSGTIIYSVLQFAIYMGFKEIYIIGADTQMSAGQLDHFDNNYCNVKNFKFRFPMDLVLAGYEVAKKYADTCGIKIYNATRGGALEVFERVDFDDLFS